MGLHALRRGTKQYVSRVLDPETRDFRDVIAGHIRSVLTALDGQVSPKALASALWISGNSSGALATDREQRSALFKTHAPVTLALLTIDGTVAKDLERVKVFYTAACDAIRELSNKVLKTGTAPALDLAISPISEILPPRPQLRLDSVKKSSGDTTGAGELMSASIRLTMRLLRKCRHIRERALITANACCKLALKLLQALTTYMSLYPWCFGLRGASTCMSKTFLTCGSSEKFW